MSSTITIASAPTGMGAPVMMRMASPCWSTRSVYPPAATSPTTGSTTGASADAPATDAATTAYPSTAELANGGTSSPATTGAASTIPTAARHGTSTTGSTAQWDSTWARASPMGIIRATVP